MKHKYFVSLIFLMAALLAGCIRDTSGGADFGSTERGDAEPSETAALEEDFRSEGAEQEPSSEQAALSSEEERIFSLVGNLVYYMKDGRHELCDYTVVSYLGEDVTEKEQDDAWNREPRLPLHKKMLISDMTDFYHEVMGIDRSIKSSDNSEMGTLCGEDGYCYSHDAAGGTDYVWVKKVKRYPDKCEIECWVMEEIGDEPIGEMTFTMIPADNVYGYALLNEGWNMP